MNFQALCPMLTNLLHNFSRNVKHPVLHYDIKITSKGGNAELNLAKVRDVIVSGPGSCRTKDRIIIIPKMLLSGPGPGSVPAHRSRSDDCRHRAPGRHGRQFPDPGRPPGPPMRRNRDKLTRSLA